IGEVPYVCPPRYFVSRFDDFPSGTLYPSQDSIHFFPRQDPMTKRKSCKSRSLALLFLKVKSTRPCQFIVGIQKQFCSRRSEQYNASLRYHFRGESKSVLIEGKGF